MAAAMVEVEMAGTRVEVEMEGTRVEVEMEGTRVEVEMAVKVLDRRSRMSTQGTLKLSTPNPTPERTPSGERT